MSDVDEVAAALAASTRRRIVAVLAESPARTGQLARATAMTPAALSRHLTVLRSAGIVDRADVGDDGRGREYHLSPSGLDDFGDWISAARWSGELARRGSEPLTRRLLGRVGAFLDAFTNADRGFFERHLRHDVQLVFPQTPFALRRQECLDSVDTHPTWRRYDIEPGAVGRDLGAHTLLTTLASIEHDGDIEPRRVFITALFAESRPWQLAHMQWTTAAAATTYPNGAPDDGA